MLGGKHPSRTEAEAEEQPPEEWSSLCHRCRNIPSTTGSLAVISSSSTGDDNTTNLPTSQQDFHSPSTAGPPVAGDVDPHVTRPEILRDPDPASDGRSERRNSLESRGGDRSLETIRKTVRSSSRSLARKRRIMSDGTEEEDYDLRPLLSTMDGCGRPRFVLEKVRSEGRLVIAMKRNERRRRVVRARSADDGEMTTRMVMIPDD